MQVLRCGVLAQQAAEHALVLGMGVGVKQRHGHRLRSRSLHVLHERARVGGAQPLQRALRRAALGRAEAQLGRDERCGRRVAQSVEVGAGLAPELDDVGEAGRGDQRGARRLALEQRVRRDRHAVGKAPHVGRRRRRFREHLANGLQHALALVARRGRDLGAEHDAVGADEYRVGERPADIDSQEHSREPMSVRRPRALGPRFRRGAGGTGSNRCAAAARAGRPSLCASSRGSVAERR